MGGDVERRSGEEAKKIFLRCLGLCQVATGAVGKGKVVKTSKGKEPLEPRKGNTEVKREFGGVCQEPFRGQTLNVRRC